MLQVVCVLFNFPYFQLRNYGISVALVRNLYFWKSDLQSSYEGSEVGQQKKELSYIKRITELQWWAGSTCVLRCAPCPGTRRQQRQVEGSRTRDFSERGGCLWLGWVPFCWWCCGLLLLWTGCFCSEIFGTDLKAIATVASSDEQPASRYVARTFWWWVLCLVGFFFQGGGEIFRTSDAVFSSTLFSSTVEGSACCLRHCKLLCRLCGMRWAPCCVTVMVMTPIYTKLGSKKELIDHICGLSSPSALVGRG